MNEQPPIWYIHGAFASPRSFAWIKSQLPQHKAIDVSYSCSNDLADILDEMTARGKASGTFDIVSHSLGGVFAAALAKRLPNVRKVVTMSSPFGGSKAAAFLQFITPGRFMGSIQPFSPLMREAKAGLMTTPVLSLVTNGGRSPVIPEDNDGVVSVASQTALAGPTYIGLPLNHFEVLLAEETIHHIRRFLWNEEHTI